MAQPPLFALATFGTNNLGYRGLLSAYRYDGALDPFLDLINGELERLPREATNARALATALRVLRRHGFGEPNADGWFADPR